jgi:hypothetical protein
MRICSCHMIFSSSVLGWADVGLSIKRRHTLVRFQIKLQCTTITTTIILWPNKYSFTRIKQSITLGFKNNFSVVAFFTLFLSLSLVSSFI